VGGTIGFGSPTEYVLVVADSPPGPYVEPRDACVMGKVGLRCEAVTIFQ